MITTLSDLSRLVSQGGAGPGRRLQQNPEVGGFPGSVGYCESGALQQQLQLLGRQPPAACCPASPALQLLPLRLCLSANDPCCALAPAVAPVSCKKFFA